MIDFQCPHCGKAIRVKPDFAGRMGVCAGCKSKIIVPAQDDCLLAEIIEEATVEEAVIIADEPFFDSSHQPMPDREELAHRWSKYEAENPTPSRTRISFSYIISSALILASTLYFISVIFRGSENRLLDREPSNILVNSYQQAVNGIGSAGVAGRYVMGFLLILGILIFLDALQLDGKIKFVRRLDLLNWNGVRLIVIALVALFAVNVVSFIVFVLWLLFMWMTGAAF